MSYDIKLPNALPDPHRANLMIIIFLDQLVLTIILFLYLKIPSTHEQCDWNWKHLRCEPFCECSYQPQWGDYHIGRSCRVRREEKFEDPEMWLLSCDLPPNTLMYKGMNRTASVIYYFWTASRWINRTWNVKNDICDSLIFENIPEDDDQQVGSKTLLEIPVRAMRKTLGCNDDAQTSRND